jgi:isopentenyldiphosphate isomerase
MVEKELLVKCDSKGNIIGPIEKNFAHTGNTRLNTVHYSTWSMIWNSNLKKYGLQLKNANKYDSEQIQKWDMSVAGHNCYQNNKPMNFNETLIKETEEEIGLELEMFSKKEFLLKIKNLEKGSVGFIFEKFHYKTTKNNEWVGLGFIMTTETNVTFVDGEVAEFQWLTPQELEKFLKTKNNYCSPLPLVFEKAEKFRKHYI